MPKIARLVSNKANSGSFERLLEKKRDRLEKNHVVIAENYRAIAHQQQIPKGSIPFWKKEKTYSRLQLANNIPT